MHLHAGAAVVAATMLLALPSTTIAGGEWPDGPNKKWFQSLQRPDNDKHPERQLDSKSLSCWGIADTVKTKFKVEAGDEKYPEDRRYAWLKEQWVDPARKDRPRSRARRAALSLPAGRYDPVLCNNYCRSTHLWISEAGRGCIPARSPHWRQFRTSRLPTPTYMYRGLRSRGPSGCASPFVKRKSIRSLTSIERSCTMKRLVIASFVIGVLAVPVQALAQQAPAGSPAPFNGLVWDPPAQEYVVSGATNQPSATNHPRRHHSRSST